MLNEMHREEREPANHVRSYENPIVVVLGKGM